MEGAVARKLVEGERAVSVVQHIVSNIAIGGVKVVVYRDTVDRHRDVTR